MTYKLKDTDKIEVDAQDVRCFERLMREKDPSTANIIRDEYPAAFAPDEGWEDVTDRYRHRWEMGWWSDVAYKIENNRIWRRK